MEDSGDCFRRPHKQWRSFPPEAFFCSRRSTHYRRIHRGNTALEPCRRKTAECRIGCASRRFHVLVARGKSWNHPADHPLEHPINYYFEDGGRSAYKLAEIVAALGIEKGRKVRLLEFASGYGMVSRHIKKCTMFDVVSCDIHPGSYFLSDQIGVKSLSSTSVPQEFSSPDKYDVVFALSFFTHMPKTSFGSWISALYNSLNAPGYLIFTCHGSACLADVGNSGTDSRRVLVWSRIRTTGPLRSGIRLHNRHAAVCNGRDLAANR